MATVGITGTMYPTYKQIVAIRVAIYDLPAGTRLVSSGYIGICTEAAMSALNFGFTVHTVLPAKRGRVSAFASTKSTSVEQLPLGTSYEDQHARIVELSDWLIAVPQSPLHGVDRVSGTALTIKLAKRAKKLVNILEV